MAEANSRTVKAGKRTYFFDVKQSKTGDNYLIITESRFSGEGPERTRSSIMIFSDALNNFLEALAETAKTI